MCYAWRQLQAAIRVLASTGDRRDRLQCAMSKLIKLKARDLPSEVSSDFTSLVSGISRFPVKNINQEIRAEVEALTDTQVTEAINKIMAMYDAVAAYQPRPVRHAGGPRSRPAPSPTWPVPAMHVLETRHGAFFHETA
jgi:hypothetical protein